MGLNGVEGADTLRGWPAASGRVEIFSNGCERLRLAAEAPREAFDGEWLKEMMRFG